MNRNKANILLIIVFISIIVLPQIVFWFVDDEKMEISITENRELYSKPNFEFETIAEYPKNFDNYYNDHLPFRTVLRKLWTELNYKIFNTTVDDRVIVGKDGWLFYRGDQSIEQAQGIIQYTEEEKEYILSGLQQNINRLKEKGIETYVLILPNKENIYKDKLPSSIPIKRNISKTEELISYIEENSEMDIIYPKEELLSAKENYQVYRKYDTHWNKIGSFIGTVCLQRAIDPNFEYDLNKMKIEAINKKDVNDLANFANLNEKLYEDTFRVVNFKDEVKYEKIEDSKYEDYISNSQSNKTVLVVGDSFRTDMVEYFSKLYRRVVFVHREYYETGMINDIKPNIVVVETVERYSESISKQLM